MGLFQSCGSEDAKVHLLDHLVAEATAAERLPCRSAKPGKFTVTCAAHGMVESLELDLAPGLPDREVGAYKTSLASQTKGCRRLGIWAPRSKGATCRARALKKKQKAKTCRAEV